MDPLGTAQKGEVPHGNTVHINLKPIPEPPQHKSFDFKKLVLDEFAWIPPKLNLASLKRVIRSSVSAWVRQTLMYLILTLETQWT